MQQAWYTSITSALCTRSGIQGQLVLDGEQYKTSLCHSETLKNSLHKFHKCTPRSPTILFYFALKYFKLLVWKILSWAQWLKHVTTTLRK